MQSAEKGNRSRSESAAKKRLFWYSCGQQGSIAPAVGVTLSPAQHRDGSSFKVRHARRLIFAGLAKERHFCLWPKLRFANAPPAKPLSQSAPGLSGKPNH